MSLVSRYAWNLTCNPTWLFFQDNFNFSDKATEARLFHMWDQQLQVSAQGFHFNMISNWPINFNLYHDFNADCRNEWIIEYMKGFKCH